MFALEAKALEPLSLRASLVNPAGGAVCVFEGVVRDHNDGHRVGALRYEAYPELALREGALIVAQAKARWPLLGVCCVHRTGDLLIGDLAVWVGVCAAHRDDAFAACRYLIDEIKARVPIWKHESYADAEAAPRWLHP